MEVLEVLQRLDDCEASVIMTTINNEFVTPLQGGARIGDAAILQVGVEPNVHEALRFLFNPGESVDTAPLVALAGTLPQVQMIRNELASFLRSGKDALHHEDQLGFIQGTFTPFPVKELGEKIAFAIEVTEIISRDSRLPPGERIAALAFNDMLEKLHLVLCDFSPDELPRSELQSLLPAIQGFKQATMEFELRLSLGMSATAPQSEQGQLGGEESTSPSL